MVDREKLGEEECSDQKPVGEVLSRGTDRDSRGVWSIRATEIEKGGRRCQAYGQAEGTGRGSKLIAT
jgi:hypothetical protein